MVTKEISKLWSLLVANRPPFWSLSSYLDRSGSCGKDRAQLYLKLKCTRKNRLVKQRTKQKHINRHHQHPCFMYQILTILKYCIVSCLLCDIAHATENKGSNKSRIHHIGYGIIMKNWPCAIQPPGKIRTLDQRHNWRQSCYIIMKLRDSGSQASGEITIHDIAPKLQQQ